MTGTDIRSLMKPAQTMRPKMFFEDLTRWTSTRRLGQKAAA